MCSFNLGPIHEKLDQTGGISSTRPPHDDDYSNYVDVQKHPREVPLQYEYHYKDADQQARNTFDTPYLGLEPLYPSRSHLAKRMLMKVVASRLQNPGQDGEDGDDANNNDDDTISAHSSSDTRSVANKTLEAKPSTQKSAPISLPEPDFFNLDHDFTSNTSFSSDDDVDENGHFF